jgi:hypothetical protein
MSDYDSSDWIPIDGPVGESIPDAGIIGRHLDRILNTSNNNLLDNTHRAAFKCAVKGLEAYTWDILVKDEVYLEEVKKLKTQVLATPQEEIDKTFELLKAIRVALDRSPIGRPVVVDLE